MNLPPRLLNICNSASNITNSKLLKNPVDCPVQSFLSSSLQVADILEHIIDAVGTSEVWQSTFSVSEEFLRRLHVIRRKNKISKAHVILDHKACRKIVKLWPFIRNTYDESFMADNHSKILLVKSDAGHKISVITSQNLTRGNRYESTVIISLPEIFDSMYQDFINLSKFHSVPLDDIFR